MNRRDFEDALNECLDMLSAGCGISECAARHREYADELVPLLRVAQATMRVSRAVVPAAEGKVRGRMRLQQALAAQAERRERPALWRRWLRMMQRPALRPMSGPIVAMFVVVFLTIVAAGGTTVASSDSVPGEPLYWVKNAKERCEERIIARSNADKAQVHARHARERGREVGELIVRGRVQDAEQVVVRLQHHLNESANYMGAALPSHPMEMPLSTMAVRSNPGTALLRETLAHDEAHLRAQLNALLNNAPKHHRLRVWRIMHQSDLGYRIVIVALDDKGDEWLLHSGYAFPSHPPRSN